MLGACEGRTGGGNRTTRSAVETPSWGSGADEAAAEGGGGSGNGTRWPRR